MGYKYTFLLPAYESAFLKEALISIKQQVYSDFHCLVSDDCSPEPIKSIFDSIVGRDSRFEYRRNEENIGGKSLISHWQLLVEMCKTEFFIMASDDDIYEPEYLQQIDKLTSKYPDVNLFRSRVKIINEKEEVYWQEPIFEEKLDQLHFFRYVYPSCFAYCEAAYCYRTYAFREKGGYYEAPLAWHSDNATHILMAENGCAFTKEVLFGFRVSGESISGSNSQKNAALKVEATFLFWDWIRQLVKNIPDDPIEKGLKGMALSDCKNEVDLNINIHLIRCSRKDFFKYLKRAQHELGLSRVMLTYNWLTVQYYDIRKKIFHK